MTSMTRFQIFLFRFLDTLVLMVTFELLAHYPNTDGSHWLKEDVQSITDEVFREKLFLMSFWFFPVLFLFSVTRLIVMLY